MRFGHLIPSPGTPAELFMSRYKWLSRWAMQFARNDRAVAEDLIQDTYLRFSQANLKIEEIRDTEALLYTYLEYVHLAHIREVARHSFTSLAEAQLDALALGLPNGPDVDRIETQNVLRRIATYVAWRKQTSKAASIVSLRFFHGYLPEEIARIALVSRQAVDERLHKGRSEVRLHLLDAAKLRAIQHGGPAETFPTKFAVPTDELLNELHSQLFRASHGNCMSAQQLAARYRNSPEIPIQRDLLAHIVSCRSCLAVVEQSSRQDQHPDGPGLHGHVVEMKRRGPQSERPTLSAKDVQNLVRRSERKQKEILEHRPTSLIVAVNGEVLASRDTGAQFNGLKVEVPTRDLKFVEVLNEYGVSLLSWVVESIPPHSEPVVHRLAEFSLNRRLEVNLQFSVQKLVIEVEYFDPFYKDLPLPSFAMASISSGGEEIEEEQRPWTPGDSSFIRDLLGRVRGFRWSPLPSLAMSCMLLLTVCFLFWRHQPSRIEPANLLQHAVATEKQYRRDAQSTIIVQQVSIRSRQEGIERSTYRDPQGRHLPKEKPLDEQERRFKTRMSRAGIDWAAPLSAQSFQSWTADRPIKSETVQTLGGDLLALRVDLDGGDVEQETITLRANDLHPVGKTVAFRDSEKIEIAELNYAVVPWGAINQDLFETKNVGPEVLVTSPQSRDLPRRQIPLTEQELIVAELEVRTVLHETHADATDRLTISRGPTGIKVSGVVEDEGQRADVKRRLTLVPHVLTTDLRTADGASSSIETTVVTPSVQARADVAELSQLEAFLLKQGSTKQASIDVTERLFGASAALLKANKARSRLEKQFPREQLSPDALELYDHLLASWREELNTALQREADAIQQTGVQLSLDAPLNPASVDMNAEIEKNRSLLRELIGQGRPNARAAPVVLAELAQSVEALREAAKQENAKISQTTPYKLPPANDARP